MKQTTTIRCLALEDEPMKDIGSSQIPSVLKVTVAFLCLVIVASYATAPPVASLADMEKRVTSDKDEYYLGEMVNVKLQLVNPFDHNVRLEPITRITYGTMQAGDPWVSADVNINIAHGSAYHMSPNGNLTILDEALSPTEPGEFRFNVLGESLTVMIHPYKEASLISPNVYLNISAPTKIRHGERFTAKFGIVNDNPYHASLPAYSSFRVSYGYTPDARARGRTHQEHVATEPATCYLALDLLGRSRIAERLDDGFERGCHSEKRKHMLATGAGDGGDVHHTTWKINFACLYAVYVHCRIGIEIFGVDCDAASHPSLWDGNLTLVPCHGDIGQLLVLPAWMSMERLGVFLHPRHWHGPRPRHLVVAPTAGGHLVRLGFGRLPLPQAIDADALTSERSLVKGLVNVPYCPHTVRQGSGRLPQAKSGQCDHNNETHDNRQKVFARVHSMLLLKSP